MITVSSLAYECKVLLGPKTRIVVGIAGPPASGKSFLAKRLVEESNSASPGTCAVAIGMDGFHLTNKQLKDSGLSARKGAPETYDVRALEQSLRRICTQPNLSTPCPEYSREVHDPVPGAVIVLPSHKIVIVEGNYLALSLAPFDKFNRFFDALWFLDLPDQDLRARLLVRHLQSGRTMDVAVDKISSVDLRNVGLIRSCKVQEARLLHQVL